jgi:hypothetical protein
MLDGITFDTVLYGENIGYKFRVASGFEINELEQSEIESLDVIIFEFGNLKANEIVEKMHNEEVYKCTDSNCFIPFTFEKHLIIN